MYNMYIISATITATITLDVHASVVCYVYNTLLHEVWTLLIAAFTTTLLEWDHTLKGGDRVWYVHAEHTINLCNYLTNICT